MWLMWSQREENTLHQIKMAKFYPGGGVLPYKREGVLSRTFWRLNKGFHGTSQSLQPQKVYRHSSSFYEMKIWQEIFDN